MNPSSAIAKYDVVIGLEVHVQINTASKIFSGDSASFGNQPNTNIGIVTLAHPGTLPMLNKEVVARALRMAIACQSDINKRQVFDRKNYFYPDLPKGYQITQDRAPLCKGGSVRIYGRSVNTAIPLEKIHLEEDAGKSIHQESGEETLLDFNRAGVPLIEIVTKPAIRSSEEAAAFVSEVRKLVRYLGISDGNMEEGSLRCDANVSLKPKGSATLGNKVEIKNLNSVRNLAHAIDTDIHRQLQLIEAGKDIVSETRMFDVVNGKTIALRTKEELNDYRYFPDPDLSPLVISDEWLAGIRESMPSLPYDLFKQLTDRTGLPAADALVITESLEKYRFFEALCNAGALPKPASNWIIGPVQGYLNDTGSGIEDLPIKAETLGALILLVEEGCISFSAAAQKVFPVMLKNPAANPESIIKEMNLQVSDDVEGLDQIVTEVLKELPLKVEAYQNGKTGIVSMFMGEIMKRTGGKADPRKATELLKEKLTRK